MIKYRTQEEKIEPIEIVRETKAQVVIIDTRGREQRESKRSDWRNWHDTWEDAHAFLIEKAESKVAFAQSGLNIAKAELVKIKDLGQQDNVRGKR